MSEGECVRGRGEEEERGRGVASTLVTRAQSMNVLDTQEIQVGVTGSHDQLLPLALLGQLVLLLLLQTVSETVSHTGCFF